MVAALTLGGRKNVGEVTVASLSPLLLKVGVAMDAEEDCRIWR